MVIGIVRIDLYMNGNRSLKAKRQTLKGLIQRVQSRYKNVSISEVGSNDLWQKATIGISFVGNDSRFVNSVLDQITLFIETSGIVDIGNREFEIIHF
jgi:uncharacterized protein YlxP (DUF503 family)